MGQTLSLLCAAKLHENQLERHLELFEFIPEVKDVRLVRRSPLGPRLSKLKNISFVPGALPLEMARFSATVAGSLRASPADWVVAFNPVPWGTLAYWAARSTGSRVCLSLIGMDFLQVQETWGWPFLQTLRMADAVTVTGRSMVRRLVELGVKEERVFVLPHSVDLERFKPDDCEKVFDVIAVGQLIGRKRLDVLLDALAILKTRGHRVSLGILGKGPLRSQLEQKSRVLGLSDQVEFLGYRDEVEAVLREAKVFCLPSEWEGVPFALMEAMATGLIPVVTGVGTIEDWVRPGENGVIVPVGDAEALANALEHSLSEHGEPMRRTLLKERGRLGLQAGVRLWRKVFSLPEE